MIFINKYNIFFKRLFLPLSIFFIIISKINAQTVSYTDIYTEKILLNPALSGLSNIGEINLNYSHNIILDKYSASFNQYFDKFNSGTGIIFSNEKFGKGAINKIFASLIYNYRFKISYKSFINTSLSGGFFQQSYNSDKMIFPDQIDPFNQNISNFSSEIINNSYTTYDFSGGISYFSNQFRTGASIYHIDKIFRNEPEYNLTPEYKFHFGKIFSVKKNNNILYITPEIIWQNQNNFNQLIYLIHGIYNIFLTRFFVKQNLYFNTFESGITLGINYAKLRVTYSYNISFNKYISIPYSSNQISLRFKIGKQKKINIKNTIYCLNF